MKKIWDKFTEWLIRTNKKSTERLIYYVGIFIIIAGIITVLIAEKITKITGVQRKCLFFETTGYYCPGCGGTRAFIHLIHGEILQSFYCNAFVSYSVILFGIFMISHTLNIISKGKIPGIKIKPFFVILAVIILIVQWLVKDILIWGWDYYVL